MLSVFILVSISMVELSDSQSCPTSYKRFSKRHTFCIQPNTTCDIRERGISKNKIEDILKLHNGYRNKVASGKEKRAGGLPTASNMFQIEWDNELATMAQKWTNNCIFERDCNECRTVESFVVGQSVAILDFTCPDQICMDSVKEVAFIPDWEKVLENFYEEVDDFDKKLISAVQFLGGNTISHFTQMIWAKTWRIGCGFTAFKTGMSYRQLYVCNYGPGGNDEDEPIYEEGKPCSSCPINSCCGSSCKDKTFPALCKMLDSNTAPIYSRNTSNLLFFCDSSPETSGCDSTATGTNKWYFRYSLLGNYLSIVLRGGQLSTITFRKLLILSKGNTFCFRMIFRKGPQIAGGKDHSRLSIIFKPAGLYPVSMGLSMTTNNFQPFDFNLNWNGNTEISIAFSVANDAIKHVLDIKEIMVFNGECSSR